MTPSKESTNGQAKSYVGYIYRGGSGEVPRARLGQHIRWTEVWKGSSIMVSVLRMMEHRMGVGTSIELLIRLILSQSLPRANPWGVMCMT